jgi:HEAT repeat protein
VRETSAWALGQIDDRAAVAPLGEAAAGDRSASVRGTAAWALGQIHPTDAPRGLIDAVADDDEDVRLKAAWALSEIRDAGALPILRDALRRERSDKVRRALVRAMVHGGEKSREALSELLRSEDASVREAAVRGLAGGSMGPWPWPWPRPRPWP